MAAERPTPLIVEPPPSSPTPSPASLVPSSPEPDSSPNSYSSSRPQSQHSSHTSLTGPSTPIEGQSGVPGSTRSHSDIELSPLAPPVLVSTTSVGPETNSNSATSSTRQVPPSPTYSNISSQESRNSDQSSWFSILRVRIHENRWLETTIGALSVAVALWLGVRGYKLAVWASWNDLRQTCAAYKQSNLALGPECIEALKGDPPLPPYWLRKWAVNGPNSTISRPAKRALRPCEGSGKCYGEAPSSTTFTFSSSVIVITLILVTGTLLVWYSRVNSKSEEVFTSSVKSNLQFTRHHDDGQETVSGQGVVIKQRPEDHDYPGEPGEIRRRIRSSQDESVQDRRSIGESSWSSNNASSRTLVPSVKESRKSSIVSLQDHSSNEKHEGLIELNVRGKRKAFFKPSTGEFLHISPWKSTHSDDNDSSDDERMKRKAEEKNSTHRALGQMVAGGVSWAVGKKLDDKLAEKLEEKNHHNWRQPPQRAGDCLAGVVTNEWPTGRPTTV